MTPEAQSHLDLARSDLAGARRDIKAGDPRLAVVRAYYATFHAAGAALISQERTARSHAGTRALFSELFVQTGRLNRDAVRTMSHLMDLRHEADYHVGGTISMEEAIDAEARATAFVDAIEAILAAP